MRGLVISLGLLASTPALADVDNAFQFCAALDATGLLSEPCSVSGWNSSVDITIDMNAGEARELCAGMAGLAQSRGITFDAGWSVRIYSPYSGDNTIAFCPI